MENRDLKLSPHRLLQEMVGGDPWRLLVACILQNKTPGPRAEAAFFALMADYPTPEALAEADVADLEERLRPLGLWRRRARVLVELSRRCITRDWSDPRQLPGVGRYAHDSYEIFVHGNLDVTPTDRFLLRYLEWRRTGSHRQGDASEGSEDGDVALPTRLGPRSTSVPHR
jgi:methyl-CpG-binding domain protein 4